MSAGIQRQCGIRGAWGAKHCSFRCNNSNHFLFAEEGGNVKQRNFVCRCKKKYPQWPNSKGKVCNWTKSSDRIPIVPQPDPKTYTCRRPNHRLKQGYYCSLKNSSNSWFIFPKKSSLKCSEKPKSCTQLEHVAGEKYSSTRQVWIENRYQCRNCFNLKIKFPSFKSEFKSMLPLFWHACQILVLQTFWLYLIFNSSKSFKMAVIFLKYSLPLKSFPLKWLITRSHKLKISD